VFQQTGSVDAATAALSADEDQMKTATGAAGDNATAVQDLITRYQAFPGDITRTVTVNTSAAQQAADALLGTLRSIEIVSAPGASRPDMNLGPSTASANGNGNGNGNGNIFAAYADGGFGLAGKFSAYASGGLENHIAQIAPKANTIRIWAEPETGGEAYIPMGSSKRARSTQILDTVADEFGYDLTPRNAAPSPIGSMTAGYGAVLPAGGGSADLVAEIRALRQEIQAGLGGLGNQFDRSIRQQGTDLRLSAAAGRRSMAR
jgi:hypothetical protein